ncbi:serine/threonine-protein kinase 11-interacting protein isoform X2 [Culicoides brevitarsis]|uniref:serine/threonine-protein kinase 11-interacting protein isoform X2 n=1 Tax=Culicoides brevitarsis TaxID=469753 RepID=UPI00307B8814
MDPQKITKLAKLLKSEGDKVLNNEYKLTLSGTLLRALNDSFTLIIDTASDESPFGFRVIRPSDAKSDVFRDLQFIYDFVQKTVTLSITGRYADDEKFEGQIDISKFVNLKTIELQKVSAKKVVGLQQFRAHLVQLICIRGLSEGIRELLVECGGDATATGFLWNDLKTADFSYNNLKVLDHSFEYTPYLETLNLSHNQLVDIAPIRCLPNLKNVNLSYNRLTRIPIFHPDVYRKLQTLSIVANYIEDILEVTNLDALMVLDLSCNCLIEHGKLIPLTALVALQELNLSENPLSCHPKHRQATARYLHKNTSTVKFCLDGEPLSATEKGLTGVYEHYCPILRSKPSESNMIRVNLFGRNMYGGDTPVGSVKSTSSSFGGLEGKFNDSIPEDLSASMISQQRRVKVREAKIASEPSPSLEKDQRRSLEGNTEHLETKKQMETLREQFGSQWLQNTSGEIIKTVVGFESKGQAEKNKAFIDSLLQAEMTSSQLSTDMNFRTSTPNDDETLVNNDQSTGGETGIETDYQSVSGNETRSDYKSVLESTLEQETTINASISEPDPEPEVTISDPEDDEVTYIVVNEQTEEEIFLVISERNIRERDTLSGGTFTKWSLKSLLSCERVKSDVISLQFDTVKKNKKLRNYRLDKSSCEKLVHLLRKHLEQRPLNEMNQKLYRCAVCIAQFSREDKMTNKEIFCPECKSSYVIEITEAPNKYSPQLTLKEKPSKSGDEADQPTIKDEAAEFKLPKSDSRSSMASGDSSSCSKISKSESSFDSNRSIAGSGPSDRDMDFQGNDSDIEVLSNPSQSSIEVLDSLHSSRKHSEERRNLPFSELEMPQGLDTIYSLGSKERETQENGKESVVKSEATTQTAVLPNKNLPLLTESSSSGSVTDSICTAYEQNQDETLTNNGTTTTDENSTINNQNVSTPSKNEVTSVIGTMFNDFLKSNKLLKGNKSKETEVSAELTEPYVFSYTDFSQVDHRLKLYLFQNIFEDDGEMLMWLTKARVFDESTAEGNLQGFDCLFVISTTKFYILKQTRAECDDPSLWLKRFISGTNDRIITARVLPFKTGITFTIRGIGNVHLLLFDIMRTDSLLLFFATENALPQTCSIEYRISEDLMQKLNSIASHQKVYILSFLKKFSADKADQKLNSDICAFVVSESGLFISSSNLKWFSASETTIQVDFSQSMSNLIEVLDVDAQTLQFNFMDEATDEPVEETWRLTFETENSSESAFETVSQCWEKIFSVPLTKISSNNNSKN